MRKILLLVCVLCCVVSLRAMDHEGIVDETLADGRFPLIVAGRPTPVLADETDFPGVPRAIRTLLKDFGRVCGTDAVWETSPAGGPVIIVGTYGTPLIDRLVRKGKLDKKSLQGKREKYVMTVVDAPMDGVPEALVIAGSDRRGTMYGIYELSEQIGVSPWYFWADVPPVQHRDLSMARGTYTAGEPAVRYRGLFLNDEAPCLTTWVKNHYGTDFGGHAFYADVFELILRLRGNFLWPAMWGWAFYADDPENSAVADEMGIVMGTSHHEPMARNHQEWTRNRQAYGGVWDYTQNKTELQRFFREGMERARNTEDLITIGMRGDGDEALQGSTADNIRMMESLFADQRRIIREVTGRPAEQRPQVWALYKEVQSYYEEGLRVPDDVTILLSDDNWGDIRWLPGAAERQRAGGWGMYYHVDYVGAPRNSKWLNVTPIQHMWDQLRLTYDYGVDRLWVLNVGDLKPMEYPIDLFMDMAWNPQAFTAENLLDHTLRFCRQQFGEAAAPEAARILNLSCKYSGRVTAEMLDRNTYDLESGEWRRVADDYVRLEAEALRQYLTLPESVRDAYRQLVLFPVQALANVYDMYYAQAMNHKLYAAGLPEADLWADRVERDFARDKELSEEYNKVMSGGKWDGMMIQKHIGYTSWNDNFPADVLPRVSRLGDAAGTGGYVFEARGGTGTMEAEHYFAATDASGARWTVIPYMGRTLSGVSLQPYTAPTDGASLTYRFSLPEDVEQLKAVVAVNATLAFARREGHRYAIRLDDGEEQIVNFNERLNEQPANLYSVYYPTVARRVTDNTVTFAGKVAAGLHTLTIRPLEPGTVFEKIVLDCGGYRKTYLYGEESPVTRQPAQ
ncbi:MAG: glycosyl hydrolase 115 family protein [Bacteroidales bacterium]|nr:glycosyl hydrolase 115 family protein [Bacteroidales bacterium]